MSSTEDSNVDPAVGGQAVVEGVMMRGARAWSVAVRRADGSITVKTETLAPRAGRGWRSWPLARGLLALGESLKLGYRALSWSVDQQMEESGEEAEPTFASRLLPFVGAVFALGLFVVVPAVIGRALGSMVGHGPGSVAVETAFRLSILLGYMAAVGCMKDVRRVFEYHGAEHKAIAAWESGAPLTARAAAAYPTAHIRCGTSFLLVVAVVAGVLYVLVPTSGLIELIVSRLVLVPVVAAVAYEWIRWSAKHADIGWVRALLAPGLLLQRLTTREPDLGQLEVACAALRAALTPEQEADAARRELLDVAA